MKTYFHKEREPLYFLALHIKRSIPELKNFDSDKFEDILRNSGYTIYTETEKPVKFILRLTMPFALLVMVIGTILLPINFMITGKWYYSSDKLVNWFKALGF